MVSTICFPSQFFFEIIFSKFSLFLKTKFIFFPKFSVFFHFNFEKFSFFFEIFFIFEKKIIFFLKLSLFLSCYFWTKIHFFRNFLYFSKKKNNFFFWNFRYFFMLFSNFFVEIFFIFKKFDNLVRYPNWLITWTSWPWILVKVIIGMWFRAVPSPIFGWILVFWVHFSNFTGTRRTQFYSLVWAKHQKISKKQSKSKREEKEI